MAVLNNNSIIGSSGQGSSSYEVSRSLRFNSADSAYLSRTPASAGNRKTYTFSCWVKKCKNASGDELTLLGGLSTANNNPRTTLYYDVSTDVLVFDSYNTSFDIQLKTNAVFRDNSAWAHVVLAVDTTQATSTNRVKLYVNNVEQTFGTTTYPSQNFDTHINAAAAQFIGSFRANTGYFNGYLADIWFLDGIAATPSDFAETDATTGQWIPKTYSGSKGSNGFHLEFADNSNNTASTLGKDTSGNGNNWTPNNFSVTAGAGNDSLVDTPTSYGTDDSLGGSVRGNYATLNPLNKNTNAASPTNGNLDYPYSSGAAAWLSIAATIGVTSGKYYWEITPTAVAGNGVIVGIANQNYNFAVAGSSTVYLGHTSNSWGYYSNDGKVYTNSAGTSYGNTFTANDVIGVALDMDNGKCWFSKNGTWQNSGSPTGGTNAAVTGLTGSTIFPAVSLGDASPNTALTANFGQRSFAYTAPSGFKALVDTNLPSPSVAKPAEVMDVKLYTGNGSSQSISSVGFSPDLVWIKQRSGSATAHSLEDIVRGTSKHLASNATDAEVDVSVYGGGVTAFNSAGFSVGSWGAVNENNQTYVSWLWDAGSSNTTNTAGSITSTVRVNATAGFSIVSVPGYTYPTKTAGHGLGVEPHFIITKNRGVSNPWMIYHKAAGVNTYFQFDTGAGYTGVPGVWSGVNSSVFPINSGINQQTDIIAYCFAPVAGYSSFGSYTGNSSADGPFVYTGFRPRFIMIKNANATTDWVIVDTARETYNVVDDFLRPNSSAAEGTRADLAIDILSNGFKQRGLDNFMNGSNTHIYAAFAESPFQYARAR